VLFAIDWDDLFFLVCSSDDKLSKLVDAFNLEGFYCDETTEQSWELSKEETRIGLAEVERQSRLEAEDNKPWWKIW